MAKTSLADIVDPIGFEKYIIERTAVKSALVQSGIVSADEQFNALVEEGKGGSAINLPFWIDLSATAAPRQVLSDSAQLTTNKISASRDYACIQRDAQSFSVNDLAKQISGEDPVGAIGELLAGYWTRIDQNQLIASLTGVFAASDSSMAGNVLNIASSTAAGVSASTQLNGYTVVDALALLGDRADRLTALAIHSATEAALKKNDLIDYLPDSEGKPTIAVFQGRRVIVDDGCPVATVADTRVFTSYLFGDGAFAKGTAVLSTPIEGGFGTEAVEFARVALGSDTLLINRRCQILHPRGVKWLGAAMAGQSPTDAELANGANWSRVYETKNVRIVAVKHNN